MVGSGLPDYSPHVVIPAAGLWGAQHSTYGHGLCSSGSAGAGPPTPPARRASSAAGGSADAHPSWLLPFSRCPACWRELENKCFHLHEHKSNGGGSAFHSVQKRTLTGTAKVQLVPRTPEVEGAGVSSSPPHWLWGLGDISTGYRVVTRTTEVSTLLSS